MKRPGDNLWQGLGVGRGLTIGFGQILLFSVAVNLLVLTSPLYMMQVYDRVLVTGQVETLLFLSVIAFAALCALGMFEGVRSFMLTRLGRFIDLKLRDVVLSQTISAGRRDGHASRSLVDDLGTARNFLSSPAVLSFLDAPWVPFFIVVMTLLHPWLGALAVGSAGLLFGLAILNDYLARGPLRVASTRQQQAGEFAAAAIQNIDVIHAMGMQRAISARYGARVEVAGTAGQHAADIGSVISAASKALRIIVQSAALGLGALLVIRAELTPGGMIAASILLGRALAPIEQSIGSWRQFVSARDAFGNVRAFLRSRPRGEKRMSLPQLQGRLEVQDLSYQPVGTGKQIVRRVTFVLEPGVALALVGPSASGKSTLCRLLVGAVTPSAGSVRLGGASIQALDPDDVHATVGYLPQSIELFAGTVKENIARLGETDEARIIAAAKAAGCHEMILTLDNGYETQVGAGGTLLSGGQRQRIGLARALYGNPRLIVLDEPNSNLDQEGELALLEAISGAKAAGATVIVVSHRMSLLRPIDKLAVLRDGVLERFGDRDDVLRELAPPAPKPTLVRAAANFSQSGLERASS